jgi:hypothetical protein
VGPSGMQQYSSFAVVEEPEVGGQYFILESTATGGVLLSFDNGGHCEDDQMMVGPLGPNGEDRRSLRRTRTPGLTENVTGPSEEWGRIWSACCLRSSRRRLR